MSTHAARAARKGAVRAAKRGLILDAALRVFEAEGLEGASMRAIGDAAGYTAAAIYFHFASKEAIYAALIDRSLDRLVEHVEAQTPARAPRTRLEAAALAFFDFYAQNPRDLDLGFYLFRGGMRPRGLSPEADAALNAKLARALAPITEAARDMGTPSRAAQAVTADIFAHAAGLLLLQHTARIRMFRAEPRPLMQAHVARIIKSLEQRS
jgi:AcrR family transcriptional regulator